MPAKEPRNSQGLPLFSQSLETQRLRQLPPPHDKFFIPQVVLFSLPALAMGALLFAARPNIAQTNKNASKAGAEKVAVTTPTGGNAADANIALDPADEGGRRPLSFYTGGVRSTMFSAPQPPKPKAPKPVVVKIEKKPEPVKLPDKLPEINPFQDWAYTGVIKMGESRMALLENTKTKEGQYVKEGESILGSQVTSITDQSITLSTAGSSTPRTLAKSDTINVTPLSANAPFLNGGGQPGGMPGGMPGMPPGGMPAMPMQMGGFPNGGTVVLPNGQAMSADRAARRAQFMNGNFRGGGGRNRGGN